MARPTDVAPAPYRPSVGVPGIDSHQTFTAPARLPAVPDTTSVRPGRPLPMGPHFDMRPPPMHDRAWWQERNASQVANDQLVTVFNGDDPLPDIATTRARDPRNEAIPSGRPINHPFVYFFTRPFAVRSKRFNPDAGHSTGKMVRAEDRAVVNPGAGLRRFRTTDRNVPTGLDTQVTTPADTLTGSQEILATGSGLRKWW